jgi:hypothetical protein
MRALAKAPMVFGLPMSTNAPNVSDHNRYRVLAADVGEAEFPSMLHRCIEESSSILVCVYCKGIPEIVKSLETFSRRQGSTLYAWTQDRGLISLREDGIVVPASRRLAEALRYVQQSVHFGIYLLPIDGQALTPPTVAQMRQIARANDGIVKRVVMLSESAEIPAALGDYCTHLQIQPRASAHLRLRDGRWIR